METIEKGKVADLVLLDANPLIDIRNTAKDQFSCGERPVAQPANA